MKIEKQFIKLILNGDKRYEFRNSDDKSGIYLLNDVYFSLKYLDKYKVISFNEVYGCYDIILKQIGTNKKEHFLIEPEEYDWFQNHKKYWRNKKIYLYEWVFIGSLDLKEIEIIGE